jgi:hypothetical protein
LSTSLYREIVEFGAVVGSLGALGGVIGFLSAAVARTLPRVPRGIDASYGEWVTYGAGLAGTLALAYESFERAGL